MPTPRELVGRGAQRRRRVSSDGKNSSDSSPSAGCSALPPPVGCCGSDLSALSSMGSPPFGGSSSEATTGPSTRTIRHRRRPHPSDKRAQLIFLTEKAAGMEEQALEAAMAADKDLFKGFRAFERELLIEYIGRILINAKRL